MKMKASKLQFHSSNIMKHARLQKEIQLELHFHIQRRKPATVDYKMMKRVFIYPWQFMLKNSSEQSWVHFIQNKGHDRRR
ncbi:hypothetical protein SAMN04488689_110187 [Paenibacillus sp. cl6col]|nr:hypothetical protein SAMN04488689_110187 [Paenibacillus sp. cl6col]